MSVANNHKDDDDSSTSDILDMRNEEGWEDVESDDIEETFVSLFDEKRFSDITEMLMYCKRQHGFDIWRLQQQHNLDFIGLVKLVNYVRQQVKQGNKQPDVASTSTFDDEMFLLPILEDDAVLYSLEDIVQASTNATTSEADELREQLASLQSQFEAYRGDVQKYLSVDIQEAGKDTTGMPSMRESETRAEQDHDYFKSYSYNTIHESMIKDKIRTDAYRDFIYDNKDLFKDKVVLDVGCGTGILSMFCAKAGAKLVLAVDNSNIVEKAKQNVLDNSLQDKVQCIRGKIEEVTLPVDRVDIIVSEWMGYCLLYESMLDSVISARDRFLAKDGLMVPSHVTIQLAPLSDSELRVSYIDFWKDVYGFNMTAMLEKAEEEVLIRIVESKELASVSATVLQLDLHTANVKDLDFSCTFRMEIKPDFGLLEGFVSWFDTYFMRSRSDQLSASFSVEEAKSRGLIAFSTGPHTQSTHWQQGVCLIKDPTDNLSGGHVVEGVVAYAKRSGEHRALDIDIAWSLAGCNPKRQSWFLA